MYSVLVFLSFTNFFLPLFFFRQTSILPLYVICYVPFLHPSSLINLPRLSLSLKLRLPWKFELDETSPLLQAKAFSPAVGDASGRNQAYLTRRNPSNLSQSPPT